MTGVEYALVISLILAGAAASMEMMDTRVEEHYSESAADIGQSDLSKFDVTTTTCAGCTTTTSTTTTTTTTTSTTTTTTAAPTTTSTTTTTTTAKPGTAATAKDSNSSGYVKKSKTYTVKGSIQLERSNGNDITRADVTYTITLKTGETETFTGKTNNSGTLSINWAGLPSDAIYPATITITSVTRNGETFAPGPAVFTWSES